VARTQADAAGVVGRLTCVVAEVDLGPAGSVKPGEIVEALLGDSSVPHQAIRAALLLGPATPAKPSWIDTGLELARVSNHEHRAVANVNAPS